MEKAHSNRTRSQSNYEPASKKRRSGTVNQNVDLEDSHSSDMAIACKPTLNTTIETGVPTVNMSSGRCSGEVVESGCGDSQMPCEAIYKVEEDDDPLSESDTKNPLEMMDVEDHLIEESTFRPSCSTAEAKWQQDLIDRSQSIPNNENPFNLSLPKFSDVLLPYLKGENFNEDSRSHLRNGLIDELIYHLDSNNLLLSANRNEQRLGYTKLQYLILKEYPNCCNEPCTRKNRRKGPLGAVMSKLADRRKKRRQRARQASAIIEECSEILPDPSKSLSEEPHPPPIQPLPVVCKLENMAEDELLDVINSQVDQFKKLSNDNSFQSGDQNDESSTSRFLEDVANSSSVIDKRLTTINENTGTISPVDQYSNNIHNSSSISRSYEDEHDVFGRHVANELRSLPEDTARRWARFQIQKVLFEAHSFEENDL